MRVYELAKEIEVSSKELLETLRELKMDVKNHMTNLTEHQVAAFHAFDAGEPVPELTPDGQPVQADVVEEPEEAPSVETPEEASATEAGSEEEAAPTEGIADSDAEAVPEAEVAPEEPSNVISIKSTISVKDFAEQLDLKPNVVIAELMGMSIFANINQQIDIETARKVAETHGFTVEKAVKKKKEPPPPPKPPENVVKVISSAGGEETVLAPILDLSKKKKKKKIIKKKGQSVKTAGAGLRPPVVTILGHVDHGKTSLLDYIRNSRVAKKEAGGITQHIGAYTVESPAGEITFLDTPGHAAFTQMRARGANLTDIAIIVIAATEGLKPQTLEAIQHVQAAGVTMMFALNKIDLPSANVDNVKSQLQQHGLVAEDWGGDYICVPVSAQSGAGVDELLEYLALQAEVLELSADPSLPAKGRVIEAQLEAGKGPTATVLIQEGTLHVGDAILCGPHAGKVKALLDHNGKPVREAGPSYAVKIMGLAAVPSAGAELTVLASEKEAKDQSAEMLIDLRTDTLVGGQRELTLEALLGDGKKELPLVLKADVQGSLEAILSALDEIKSEKVRIKPVLSGIGPISENDVMLAAASSALTVAFGVKVEAAAERSAKREGVEVREYKIIYELLDDIKLAMEGLLDAEFREQNTGYAEVRAIFPLDRKGNVAGTMITKGKVSRASNARVLRNKREVWSGKLTSLKRYQDDAKEVREGQECGIMLERFNDFQEGDILEFYEIQEMIRAL